MQSHHFDSMMQGSASGQHQMQRGMRDDTSLPAIPARDSIFYFTHHAAAGPEGGGGNVGHDDHILTVFQARRHIGLVLIHIQATPVRQCRQNESRFSSCPRALAKGSEHAKPGEGFQ